MLDLDKGGPALTMERVAFDNDGRPSSTATIAIAPTCTASRRRSSRS
ncbi:hypothetical protein [Microbacterium sp. SS28]